MIISRAEVQSVLSAYRTNAKRRPSETRASTSLVDTFDPSDALRSLGHLDDLAPYFRSDLVSDLRRRISEGQYYISTDQIVEKMLGRLLAENLVEA